MSPITRTIVSSWRKLSVVCSREIISFSVHVSTIIFWIPLQVYYVSESGSSDNRSYAILWYIIFSHQKPKTKMVESRRGFEAKLMHNIFEEVHDWNIPRNIWQVPLQTHGSPSWSYCVILEMFWNPYCPGSFPFRTIQSTYQMIVQRNI